MNGFRLPALPLAVLAVWLATALPAPAAAQQGSKSPVLVTADTLKYDQSLGLVSAEGKVELSQDTRTLLADMVTYSERDDKVTASGNVSLMEADGSVLFADYMELTGGMRDGFIRDAAMLLSDNSRGAAAYAERHNGNTTVLRKAIYTTCSLCASDPSRPPLWALKGEQVVHDQAAQEIRYRDATFELFGVPILYTPYFSHPDPTVNRRSGFLAPSYLSDTFFGQVVKVPYYYVIDDESDLTLVPQYTTKQDGQLYGEYRQRTSSGEIQVDGSFTSPVDKVNGDGNIESGDRYRGHIRANAAFRANDDVTLGANIFRASDKTYLSRYSIPDRPSANVLTSRLYGEAINDRNYFGANAFAFQNLRTSTTNGLTPVTDSAEPVVAPLFDYSLSTDPGDHGGRWTFDANMASLYRATGSDYRRLSATATWSQPYYAPSGEVYTATAMLKTDGYWLNDADQALGAAMNSGQENFTGRAIPLVALDWRYPLVRDDGNYRELVEPIVMAVVTPYGGNPKSIPNEDSLSFEFDETNLFSLNRFPGYDRWDGGPKLNYGLRSAIYGPTGGYSELLVGQSLRAKSDDTFAAGSGLSDQWSDYVARLTVSPGRYFSLVDRVRVSQNEDLTVQRHEATATLGSSLTYLSVTYGELGANDFVNDTGDREAVAGTLRTQWTKYWSTEFRHTRDLGADGGSLLNFAALRYTDECFDIMLVAQRTFTLNEDIKPSTTIGVRFRIATFN
ncbi:LPS-assembly protein LptD [Ferrovibrio xuzhouensis]|uniref:LPS-assembly protein LptD n=1 Tax=Ferrovibrio xuzhouensis TaxID=1576914 RepID=A0ABV7VHH7_9PROT